MEILKEDLIKLNQGLFQIVLRTKKCKEVGMALVQYGIVFGAEAKKIVDKYPESELALKINELQTNITNQWPSQQKCLEEILTKVPIFQKWFYNKYQELKVPSGGPFEVDDEAKLNKK